MRLGLGLSLLTNSSSGIIGSYVQDYIERVGLDSGVSEANSCLSSNLGSLIPYNPTFLNIPSSYKSGKMYSILPSDGSADITFTRTSVKYRTNSSFDLEELASGVPSLSYRLVQDGVTSCPMWKYETQRENLSLHSQNFSNVSWVKDFVSVSANATTAPDGTNTADSVIEDTNNNLHFITQDILSVANAKYALSIYVKANGRTKCLLQTRDLPKWATPKTATFDLEAGSSVGGDIQAVGNGWFRISILATFGGSLAVGGLNIGLLNDIGSASYTGDGVSGIYVWQSQYEPGSYVTSPIKTDGTAVVRQTDSSSLTGLKSKGLIGASAGTIGGDFYARFLERDLAAVNIELGTSAHTVFWFRTGSSRLAFYKELGSLELVSTTTQDYNKWIFSWDASGWFLSVNGSVVGSGSDVFTFPTDTLLMSGVGGEFYQGNMMMKTTKVTQTEANNYTTL